MSNTVVPDNYAAWKHCIEVDCGLTLDLDYVRGRIAALENPADIHTQQFVRRWGDLHRQRVIGWFHRAEGELDS